MNKDNMKALIDEQFEGIMKIKEEVKGTELGKMLKDQFAIAEAMHKILPTIEAFKDSNLSDDDFMYNDMNSKDSDELLAFLKFVKKDVPKFIEDEESQKGILKIGKKILKERGFSANV